MTTATAQVGVTGLAVMGANLARNLARHGHTVALHNRTAARTEQLVAAHGMEGSFVPCATIEEFQLLGDDGDRLRHIL
jgi:6-phosphogluconate dehydrogenase